MNLVGPMTALERSEGKRKAVEAEADKLAHEAAKLNAELDEANSYCKEALKLAEERLAKGAKLEEELDEERKRVGDLDLLLQAERHVHKKDNEYLLGQLKAYGGSE